MIASLRKKSTRYFAGSASRVAFALRRKGGLRGLDDPLDDALDTPASIFLARAPCVVADADEGLVGVRGQPAQVHALGAQDHEERGLPLARVVPGIGDLVA